MTPHNTNAIAEAQVKERIESFLTAARAKDVDAIMTHYAPNVVAFDAIGPLQFKGKDAYGQHWKACMEMCPMELGLFELHEVTVVAGEDVACTHALLKCGGTNDKGEIQSGWLRLSGCWRRIDGTWLIAHEHISVPFDMESGKALMELEP